MNREQMVPESADAYSEFLQSLRQQRAQRKAGVTKRRKALSKSERDAILSKTGRKCHICGGEIARDWEADHVLAHAGGGVHSIDNYLPAHPVCNNYRWDYLPDEFQEILRLGVWLRTQIEKKSKLGIEAAGLFVENEKHRISRRAR